MFNNPNGVVFQAFFGVNKGWAERGRWPRVAGLLTGVETWLSGAAFEIPKITEVGTLLRVTGPALRCGGEGGLGISCGCGWPRAASEGPLAVRGGCMRAREGRCERLRALGGAHGVTRPTAD